MAAGVGDPSHRALGVHAAQVVLEAAHAPAAIAAQLQVAVALVGALNQQRDGLGLHVRCAVSSAALGDAKQAASLPPANSVTTVHVSGARAAASGAFYRDPAPQLS